MKFKAWLEKCDELVEHHVGIGLHHLEDWNWLDAHEDDFTPTEAVKQFLEELY